MEYTKTKRFNIATADHNCCGNNFNCYNQKELLPQQLIIAVTETEDIVATTMLVCRTKLFVKATNSFPRERRVVSKLVHRTDDWRAVELQIPPVLAIESLVAMEFAASNN